MNHIEKSETGDALVTVALTLTVIVMFLALAVDAGMAYAERRKMQNAADAASLAGAEVLFDGGTDSDVLDVIDEYALTHNLAGNFEAVYLPSGQAVGSGSVPSDATGVQVKADEVVSTFFAGIFGIDTMSVSGTAAGGFAPVDIVLVIDRSGSMDDDSCIDYDTSLPSCHSYSPFHQNSCINDCNGTWTIPPQPITDAKEAAKSFVDMNNPTLAHLAAASYAANYGLDQGLTDNFGLVKGAIDSLSANGCTNAAGGLSVGIGELNGARARDDAQHFIVFLTDGLPNKGPTEAQSCSGCPDNCPVAKQAALDQADIAADDHIVIYTIALGSKADQNLMQDIADTTGGQFYYAPSSSDLQSIYEQIFSQIRLRLIQ